MKLNKTISFLFLLFITINCYTQEYWEIYPKATIEVQEKMSSNKNIGINILTDIVANHEFSISKELNKISFENLIEDNNDVLNHEFTNNQNQLRITCNASFSVEKIEALINEAFGTIINHNVTYSVKK